MATATVSPVKFCIQGHDCVYLCVISIRVVSQLARGNRNLPSRLMGSARRHNYMDILPSPISTTNLAACVCVSSKCNQFLPGRFYFVSKRPGNFVRIAKFPYAAFGPLFAFHCPLFVTKNNNLGWNRHASPHTGTCRCNDHGPTVLSARGQ